MAYLAGQSNTRLCDDWRAVKLLLETATAEGWTSDALAATLAGLEGMQAERDVFLLWLQRFAVDFCDRGVAPVNLPGFNYSLV